MGHNGNLSFSPLVILPDRFYKPRSYPHWHCNKSSCSYTYPQDMFKSTQPSEYVIYLFIIKGEGISTCYKHFSEIFVFAYPVNCVLQMIGNRSVIDFLNFPVSLT